MKLPPRLKIGALTYRVRTSRKHMNQVCRDDSRDLLGRCSPRTLTISIEPRQAAGAKRDTITHEALHALFDQVGLAQEWGTDTEETVVARLTPALVALLRDNPAFVAYVTR